MRKSQYSQIISGKISKVFIMTTTCENSLKKRTEIHQTLRCPVKKMSLFSNGSGLDIFQETLQKVTKNE